jgi:ABC-type transporter Mla subunit MlaD
MRRLATGALLTVALVVGAVFAVGAGGGGGAGYEVRAMFDDVANAVPGEDVRVAGARVGKIGTMDVTAENKAAVVLKIDDGGFAPFHADARCTIRPQSLIGEKFVECEPGSATSPELREITDGPGKGQHLLPLNRTSAPVDLDLINDTLRLPFRQRFSIILSELGAGFAGRGKDLNQLIHRANPALRETDRLLKQLAAENQTLADLARDSDVALAPLARDRRHLSSFIREANRVGEATAARRADIERSIQKLPRFLQELKPTMQDLGALSDEMTPVLTDLGTAAPSLGRFVAQLGPFSRSSTTSLTSLGKATDVGGPVLERAGPVVRDLKSFAANANPVSKNLDALTKSLDESGGIEYAMDYIFFQMTGINGFDSLGHYLRAGLIVNTCSVYTTDQAGTPGCSAHFRQTKDIPPGAAATADASLAKTRAALARAKGRKAPVRENAATQSPVRALGGVLKGLLDLAQPKAKAPKASPKYSAARKRLQARAQSYDSPALAGVGPTDKRDQALLGYLMGNDG